MTDKKQHSPELGWPGSKIHLIYYIVLPATTASHCPLNSSTRGNLRFSTALKGEILNSPNSSCLPMCRFRRILFRRRSDPLARFKCLYATTFSGLGEWSN